MRLPSLLFLLLSVHQYIADWDAGLGTNPSGELKMQNSLHFLVFFFLATGLVTLGTTTRTNRAAGVNPFASIDEPPDVVVPNVFLLRLSAPCVASCRAEVQSLLEMNNNTQSCKIGTRGVNIGSIHFESIACENRKLFMFSGHALKYYGQYLVHTVRRALARAGTRPLFVENDVRLTIPTLSNRNSMQKMSTPEPNLNTMTTARDTCSLDLEGFHYLMPKPSNIPCSLFGIDETDGGFPRDGLRTCAQQSNNGKAVSVWILDSGCKPLRNGSCESFLEFDQTQGECTDEDGHGTVVSDIATGRNGVAVESIRHCLRVSSGQDVNLFDLLLALNFVSENLHRSVKGNIINLSLQQNAVLLSANPTADSVVEIVDTLISMGAFFVLAAGNMNMNACDGLAILDRSERFFTVQAHNADGLPFEGNNFGEPGRDCVDISAPGVGISTANRGMVEGTSFAAPHVSGAIAVLLSDERTVDVSTLTNRGRLINNLDGLVDQPSLGLSCPTKRKKKGLRKGWFNFHRYS